MLRCMALHCEQHTYIDDARLIDESAIECDAHHDGLALDPRDVVLLGSDQCHARVSRLIECRVRLETDETVLVAVDRERLVLRDGIDPAIAQAHTLQIDGHLALAQVGVAAEDLCRNRWRIVAAYESGWSLLVDVAHRVAPYRRTRQTRRMAACCTAGRSASTSEGRSTCLVRPIDAHIDDDDDDDRIHPSMPSIHPSIHPSIVRESSTMADRASIRSRHCQCI